MWYQANLGAIHKAFFEILDLDHLRESADTGFPPVQNCVKLDLNLKNQYDQQQASKVVQIMKFMDRSK